MFFYQMYKSNTHKIILLLTLIMLMPHNGYSQNKLGGKAQQHVVHTYSMLNSYAGIVKKNGGYSIEIDYHKQKVLECFIADTECLVQMDIYKLVNNRDPSMQQTLRFYLQKLEEIAKDREVFFSVVGKPSILKNEIIVTIEVVSTANSYRCKAKVGINGSLKICYIRFSDFENIPNIEIIKPPKEPAIHQTMLNFSAGVKLTNGTNLGFGIGGLSNNWFLNRMKFGIEYELLFGQKYPHYPTASGSMPSTLTYAAKKNGDFGLGINIGYMFFPGKYDSYDIRDWNYNNDRGLSFFIGIGGVFYDFWDEKTGPLKSDYTSHYNSALYIKPSLRWDIGNIGLETGYYICPQYNPIRGFCFQMTLNIQLKTAKK